MTPHAHGFPEHAWCDIRPNIIALRHWLHQHPELSGAEHETASRIRTFLATHGTFPYAEGVGGSGLLYRLEGTRPGPTILLRADLDALPLHEASGASHASEHVGRHHACGHDGHSAMLAGALALLQHDRTRFRGSVFGLFQPAEEVGEGMAGCLRDPALAALPVDKAFALHNLPGAPAGTLVLPQGPAAAASTGIRIRLEGTRAHASEPHLARNPIHALAEFVGIIQQSPTRLPFGRVGLATITSILAGQDSFGSSPDAGTLTGVLRADTQGDLDAMIAYVKEQVSRRALAADLVASMELVEPFPSTTNHERAFEHLKRAARTAGIHVEVPPRPFPWSEDFGHASRRWPSALAGLGAGEAHPTLHSATYDFPDPLLDVGVRLWWAAATAVDD